MHKASIVVLLALASMPRFEPTARSQAISASDNGTPPRERYELAAGDYQRALEEFVKRQRGAKTQQERAAAREEIMPVLRRCSALMLEIARRHPNDPAAFDALYWIASNDDVGAGRTASLEILARDHASNPRLGELIFERLTRDQWHDDEALLRAISEGGAERSIRGRAMFALGLSLKSQAELARRVAADPGYPRTKDPAMDPVTRGKLRHMGGDEIEEAAKVCFLRAAKDYGDVTYLDRRIAERADSEVFEVQHLAVGRVAPEIEGKDVSGATFKLSDYKGKVVVLTFSGNWCGPCREMYPQERDLVESHRGQPFAVLSVNTDAERSTLEKSIRVGEITWRCWWDGKIDGPISSRWNVVTFPAVYVLDGEGVIRYKGIQGQDLDGAVANLLSKSKP